MLEKILNLDGVVLLNKEQQQAVNGGEKCRTIEVIDEPFGPYNGGVYSSQTCVTQCRPSFLGIGFGEWSEPKDGPCGAL